MPAPQTPYEAVLQAARDVTKLDSALDAEMLGGALLGSVYAIAEADRAGAVRDFVGGFLRHTARRRGAAATTIRGVFASLVPDAAGAAKVRAAANVPPWSHALGKVRRTGCWAYGDVYGDQTSYLATFAYEDEKDGGPEHAVVALVDHNIGIVKDAFVSSPAERIVGEVRRACSGDEMVWFAEADPARMRDDVGRHLRITDGLADLPGEGSLATDRALVGVRLALLPEPTAAAASAPLGEAERGALVADFLASPEAATARLAEADSTTVDYCLSLVVDHAGGYPEPDPLRWSPAVAELFLLDWVHRRALLDTVDAELLPRVLLAWVGFAGRRRGLPHSAIRHTEQSIVEMSGEFARLCATGERRSPATRAVAALMADGVDPADPAALDQWLRANPNLN